MRIEDQIIHFMLNIDRDTSSKEIAYNIKRNPNSVRSKMSQLLRKGIIKRKRHGVYSIIEGYGVWGRSIPLRFQNLHLRASANVGVRDKGRVDVVEFPHIQGDVFRIRVVYGFTHQQITWTVKAPIGLDYDGLKLASLLVECMISRRGYSVSSWEVGNFETLQDHMGLKIEGLAKCVTLDDLSGNMLKIYQKSYGVRVELASRSDSTTELNTLLALSTGGMPQAQLMQGLHTTNSEISDLTNAIKYRNVDDHSRDSILQALSETVIRMNNKLDFFVEEIRELKRGK